MFTLHTEDLPLSLTPHPALPDLRILLDSLVATRVVTLFQHTSRFPTAYKTWLSSIELSTPGTPLLPSPKSPLSPFIVSTPSQISFPCQRPRRRASPYPHSSKDQRITYPWPSQCATGSCASYNTRAWSALTKSTLAKYQSIVGSETVSSAHRTSLLIKGGPTASLCVDASVISLSPRGSQKAQSS